MKHVKLYCVVATFFACLSSYAQESGGGGAQLVIQEKKGIIGIPQFHPWGFYMTFGYVFDRGSASGTFSQHAGNIERSYSYAYHAHGMSFDFGGKIFSKKKLSNSFQVGADLASTAQFCFVTTFTNQLSTPYIMYYGIKAGPSFAWNFSNKRFILLTPMIGVDYFGLTMSPSYNDGSSYPWEIARYSWDGACSITAGLKVEYIIKRLTVGTSCFYNPTFAYSTGSDVISRVQYSAFIGFKLSNPTGKK